MTKELIRSIFGEYQPLMEDYMVGEDVFTRPVSGLAGVDWEYVLGVLLFALTLYCVLRILGKVISRA